MDANALTALDTDVRALDASIGGFGGCPFAPAATGNIAIDTGVQLQGLIDAATWLGGALDKDVPALLGRAGGFP